MAANRSRRLFSEDALRIFTDPLFFRGPYPRERIPVMRARGVLLMAVAGLLSVVRPSAQARKVQVGYCSNLKSVDAAKAAGFEYLELGTSELAALSDDDF